MGSDKNEGDPGDREDWYAPPASADPVALDARSEGVAARDVFLSWEKWLRPSYNIVLTGVAVLVILDFAARGYPIPRNARTAFHLVTRAVAANLLFTAGPFADYYVAVLLRRRSRAVTAVLFLLGTLLSAVLVPISLTWFWSTQYPVRFPMVD